MIKSNNHSRIKSLLNLKFEVIENKLRKNNCKIWQKQTFKFYHRMKSKIASFLQ